MIMELFKKGEYMNNLMSDYWMLNRKLLGVDDKYLLQDNFWEYAMKEMDEFYEKYKTDYAKNMALGLMKELENRYNKKQKEMNFAEQQDEIEDSLPWASAQV